MSLTAALLLALQGGAAPGTLTFDVRCMIALGQLGASGDQQVRAAASTASQFYFGRIDARVPDAELEAVLVRETRDMTEAPSAQLLEACGAYMAGRGERLAEAGRRMEQRAARPRRR